MGINWGELGDATGFGGSGNTSIADKIGNALNTSVGGDSSVGKAATKVAQQTVKVAKATTAATLAQAKAFVKNPFPTLLTMGLSTVMPYAYASAITNVLNGGDWKKAVIQMGMNYFATGSGTGPGPSTMVKVLTSSSTAALSTKLLGGTNEEVRNAAVGGAVNTYMSDLLYKPTSQGGYGLNPRDVSTKMMTNSVSAATNAILRGQNVGDAIVNSALVTGGAHYVQLAYEKVTKNSETLQQMQATYDSAKAKVMSIFTKPLEDKQKQVDAEVASARIQIDRARKTETYAKQVNNDYANGKANGPYGQYTADQAEDAAKYAVESNDAAQRAIDRVRQANNELLMMANSSGYTAASQEYQLALNQLTNADNNMGASQKEFLDSYKKYEDTVAATKSFLDIDIAEDAAKMINDEIKEAARVAKEAEDNVAENSRKTQEAEVAYQKQQAVLREQEAQVKAAQAYKANQEAAEQKKIADAKAVVDAREKKEYDDFWAADKKLKDEIRKKAEIG